MSSLSSGEGLYNRGQQHYVPLTGRHRPMGWTDRRALRCPQGHHIKEDAILLTDGVIRCPWRGPQASGTCGALLYVLAVVPPRGTANAEGLYFVAAVTWAEVKRLRDEPMAVLDALELLGATWNGDTDDIEPR